MPKKGEYIKFKNYERKVKSWCMIYEDFEIIFMPEDNERQNTKESYTNKYQKHIACSSSYKLVCVDDKFSKPFKTYLGKVAVYNLINSMIKESKYYSGIIIKHFNKERVIAKEDHGGFKNSSKCCICDNDCVDNDAKVSVISLETIEALHIEILM